MADLASATLSMRCACGFVHTVVLSLPHDPWAAFGVAQSELETSHACTGPVSVVRAHVDRPGLRKARPR